MLSKQPRLSVQCTPQGNARQLLCTLSGGCHALQLEHIAPLLGEPGPTFSLGHVARNFWMRSATSVVCRFCAAKAGRAIRRLHTGLTPLAERVHGIPVI